MEEFFLTESKTKTQHKTKNYVVAGSVLPKLTEVKNYSGQPKRTSRTTDKTRAIAEQRAADSGPRRHYNPKSSTPQTEAGMKQAKVFDELFQQSIKTCEEKKNAPEEFYKEFNEEIKQKQNQIAKGQDNFIKNKTNKEYEEAIRAIEKKAGLKKGEIKEEVRGEIKREIKAQNIKIFKPDIPFPNEKAQKGSSNRLFEYSLKPDRPRKAFTPVTYHRH